MPSNSHLGWKILVLLAYFVPMTAGRADEGSESKMVPANFRSYIVIDERFPKIHAETQPDPKNPPEKNDTPDPRDRTHKLHCFVTEQGQNPVVMIFTRVIPKPDSVQGNLIKQVNDQIKKHQASRMGAIVEVLTLAKEFNQDDRAVENDPKKGLIREIEAENVRTFAVQLRVPSIPFGLAAGSSEQVDKWDIAADDELIVVLYNHMKIVQRWSFKAKSPPTEEDVKSIIETIDKTGAQKN